MADYQLRNGMLASKITDSCRIFIFNLHMEANCDENEFMDNCYIPNNLCSQYGLEYEEAVVGSSPITPTSSTQPQFSQCVWNFNPEEMGSFSISPLDLQDSVSSNFFPASPCSSTTSNNNCNYSCK